MVQRRKIGDEVWWLQMCNGFAKEVCRGRRNSLKNFRQVTNYIWLDQLLNMLPCSPLRSLEFIIIPPSRLLSWLYKVIIFQPNRSICWDSWWQGSPFLGTVHFFGPLLAFFPIVLFTTTDSFPDILTNDCITRQIKMKIIPPCYVFALESESSEMASGDFRSTAAMERCELSAHLKVGHVRDRLQRHWIWG